MSDSSRGRSYVMFNYNYIGWNPAIFRQVTQGFQSDRSGGSFVLLNFFTTGRSTAYSLANLPGNFRKFAESFDKFLNSPCYKQ
jgi:hypothetical protein